MMDPDEPKKKRLKLALNSILKNIFEMKNDQWNCNDKYAVCKLCENSHIVKIPKSNIAELHEHAKTQHSKIYQGLLDECEMVIINKIILLTCVLFITQ